MDKTKEKDTEANIKEKMHSYLGVYKKSHTPKVIEICRLIEATICAFLGRLLIDASSFTRVSMMLGMSSLFRTR